MFPRISKDFIELRHHLKIKLSKSHTFNIYNYFSNHYFFTLTSIRRLFMSKFSAYFISHYHSQFNSQGLEFLFYD